MLPGPYVIPAYRSVGHVRLTNKTLCGAYRVPGRFEGSFVRERLVDAIADRLGLDPFAVRHRNFITKAAMPFRREFSALGTDIVYDTGDYAGLLDKFLKRVDWETLQTEVTRRQQAGDMVGLGLGFFVEKSGLGPFDDVRGTLGGDGRIEVITGAASIGQGVETVMAQICADGLGIGLEQIRVIHGQTLASPRRPGARLLRGPTSWAQERTERLFERCSAWICLSLPVEPRRPIALLFER